MRNAMRGGARDYLHKPLDPEGLREAVYTVLNHEEQRQMARWAETSAGTARGTVVTIVGAKGGVGRTTIASNLSVALRQLTGQEVALVDADAQFGESALTLGLDVDTGVADLVRNEAELSRLSIGNYLRRHDSGVQVLSAAMEPEDWRSVRPEQLEAIAEGLAEGHEYVLIDTPGILLEVTNAALSAAGVVLLVTSLELASVKNTKPALRMLDSWSIPRDRVRLIVNDNSHAAGVTATDVVSATGMDMSWEIGFDARVSGMSQSGVPIVLSHPNGRFAQAIDLLARGLAGMPADCARGGRSLLDLLDRLPVPGRRAQ